MADTSDQECAWLTTLRSDGSPHTTPVWFVVHRHAIWIGSAATNVKVRNLAADSRVSVAIDGSGFTPQVAQGRARIHRDLATFPDVLSLFARKYRGWDVADEATDGERVLLQISVDRWLLGSEPQVRSDS
ncbi:pyridoxamine 5'-phosphate oxidase family protein [Conyzicola sp.]|uniref:pyridoxamine 5'-phosphate oxidase family protein n=1 Tax=Conyzicola sp. TaxID=1969404 RepID=UPI003989CDCC